MIRITLEFQISFYNNIFTIRRVINQDVRVHYMGSMCSLHISSETNELLVI